MTWSMIAALGGMIGLPLTIMCLYLRAIRDDQKQLRADHAALERRVGYIERDYATKEELVRETAQLRQQMDKAIDLLIAVQAKLETENGLTGQLNRLVEAMIKKVQ